MHEFAIRLAAWLIHIELLALPFFLAWLAEKHFGKRLRGLYDDYASASTLKEASDARQRHYEYDRKYGGWVALMMLLAFGLGVAISAFYYRNGHAIGRALSDW